jgi:hypothetical protein
MQRRVAACDTGIKQLQSCGHSIGPEALMRVPMKSVLLTAGSKEIDGH